MGLRRNQNKLSETEKRRFITAIRRMKSDDSASYSYNKYVRLHEDVARSLDPDINPAHLGPAFLPWHRYLLAKFEQDLQAADRAAGGDGSITLPYWDWTQDNAGTPNRQRGNMWHDDFMGGGGSPPSGSFRDWVEAPSPFNPGPPGPLSRDFGALLSTLPRTADVDRALAAHGFDCPPFRDLRTHSPSSSGLAAPSAPAASGAAGGTLAAGLYRVATTYASRPVPGLPGPPSETLLSPETVVCLGGGCAPANTNNAIQVPSPPVQAGAEGYWVYVSTPNGATATMTRQGGLTAIGTASRVNALVVGAARPTVNTTATFRNHLEGWSSARSESEVHNRVHLWVGGSMAPATSPNDPVFFLHHCNVDRLWALWQFRHPGQNYPLLVPRVGGPGNRPQGLNDAMPPWLTAPELVRPVDVLNHTSITVDGRAMGYTYDTDPPGVAVNVAP